MAIDRVVLLRNAEQLLRQGKLDQAIAEYRRIVDDQPRDWNSANVLGDLYLRAGQIDKAIEAYTRVADNLGVEGFLPKAGALYKKILKIRPHDEYVLLQAAEIAASQELFVDLRAYLDTALELGRSRGDVAGIAIANELTQQGRLVEALAALREAAHLAPSDIKVKRSIAQILADLSDQESANETAGPVLEVSAAPVAQAAAASPTEERFVAEDPVAKPAENSEAGVLPIADPESTAPKDLDDVFADMRAEAAQRFATNNPEQELATGLAFYHAGQLELAVPRLEAASRAPANRFAAAATLGRILLERGDTWHAIDWFERAAEAPAPTPGDGHRLLYELADALEGAGEAARALAICLELRADAGEYQDVSKRVDRLSQLLARG